MAVDAPMLLDVIGCFSLSIYTHISCIWMHFVSTLGSIEVLGLQYDLGTGDMSTYL